MNYFFSPVEAETLLVMEQVDLDSLFYNNFGEAFWFKMVMDEDSFFIVDTSGRMIPFDREQADELAAATMAASAVFEAADISYDMFDSALDGISEDLEAMGFPGLE